MPARFRNFIAEKGADFSRILAVTDVDGSPLDLTLPGYAAVMYIEVELDSGSALKTLTSNTGGGLVLGNGALEIDVAKADMGAIDLSAVPRSGSLTEPSPDGADEFFAEGKLVFYRLLINGPEDYDDDCVLRGQICFANR